MTRRDDAPAPLPGSDRFGPASEVWDTDAWRWEVTRWFDDVLPRRGITRHPTTPRQPRVRPWSTQLVIETDQGRGWFKANVPESSPETLVYERLSRVAPDLLLPVWVSDAEREWFVCPDQGRTLRQVANADTITSLWSAVLRRYARLQRASAGVVDALVDGGVPRWESHALVSAWVARGRPEERVADEALRSAADRLEALELPPTIEHGDLHAGNVFTCAATSSAMQEAKIFDWGDAYVGHPFGSLLIALRNPEYHFGLAADPERDQRLVRAYLSGWADVRPVAELERVVPDAMLLARVARILSWDRALTRATDAERAQWQPHADGWAQELVRIASPRSAE